MSARLGVLLACTLLAAPVVCAGQAINGVAEWTVVNGGMNSDGTRTLNNSFWQNYTIGYTAPLIDDRLLTWNGELSLHTNSLVNGEESALQEGHQGDAGYKLGVALFPKRPFPLFMQLSRDAINESANYPASSAVRGGIVIPANSPTPDFHTTMKAASIGWQLNEETLPHIDLGYRSNDAVVTGGPYVSEQQDSNLHASVTKDTERTRQLFRYERTVYENQTLQVFNQRIGDLAYDFTAMPDTRTRITTRIGRRSTFSLFDLPTTVVDPGTPNYAPPARGDVTSVYAITGISFAPTVRLAVDMTASADRQDATIATTSARLVSGSARYELFRNLQLTGIGTFGSRGQVTTQGPIDVITRSAVAGASYHAGKSWLEGTLSGTRGTGVNTTPDGQVGPTSLWTADAGLSSSIRWVTVGVGGDRAQSRDQLLDYGNYYTARRRISVQALTLRYAATVSWEDLDSERGRGLTYARTRQRTFSGVLTYRVNRHATVSGTAGGFVTDMDWGHDETKFVGGAFTALPRPALQIDVWVRDEAIRASQTGLNEQNLSWLAQVEYHMRALTFGVEYRRNSHQLEYATVLQPYHFDGRQLRVRISRRFGVLR